MSDLQHLLSPITVKNTSFPNRVVIPPMGTGLSAPGGIVNDALLAYVKRQAKGGAGLFISEITAVHENGAVSIHEVGAYDDKFIAGLAKLAEAMRSGGGKAAIQLHHGGRESFYMLNQGRAIGPSAIPSLIYRQPPKEMTLADIEEIVESFGTAAARGREAGFDAVEIHGAHGYLLTQFLSAISNQRSDQYGGDFANRAKFVIDVVRSVRKHVGDDFPVLLRISAEEFIKNGYTVEDVVTILPDLIEAGIDIIHASIGTHGSPGSITSASPVEPSGFNVWRAKTLKEAGKIPVIAVGRFNDPGPADDVIKNGEADFVAFGRQQLCDPDFLAKAIQKQSNDIRKCIACNQGCIEREIFEHKSVRCAINPETGQELVYPQTAAKDKRKVLIVGAGPAGLTAAYEAKRLGHTVRLLEREAVAGGNLLYACKAPHKEVYGEWIQWLIGQVEKIGVEIETGREVSAETIADLGPDAVILASGGRKIIPDIEGIDQPIVCDAWQILGEQIAVGKNVAVIGGGLIGMETATFLGARDAKVVLIEQLEQSPVPKFTSHGYAVHKQLRTDGCQFRFGSALKKITADGIVIAGKEGEETIADLDQVVLAVGMKPRKELEDHLKQNDIRHFVVGDALEVRRIMEATEEGAQAAWDL